MVLVYPSSKTRPVLGMLGHFSLGSLLLLTGCQSYIQRNFLPSEEIRPASSRVNVVRGVAFSTSDGTRLVADLFRPDNSVSAPTILVRIPFTNTFSNRLRSDGAAHFWASRGYNVVIQGTRGRYKSGGTLYPLLSEREDG